MNDLEKSIPDDIKSKLCTDCSLCCQFVGILSAHSADDNYAKSFYETRGFKVTEKTGRLYLSKYAPCQHLEKSTGKCGIYQSRPEACRDYSCLAENDTEILGPTGWSEYVKGKK